MPNKSIKAYIDIDIKTDSNKKVAIAVFVYTLNFYKLKDGPASHVCILPAGVPKTNECVFVYRHNKDLPEALQ